MEEFAELEQELAGKTLPEALAVVAEKIGVYREDGPTLERLADKLREIAPRLG